MHREKRNALGKESGQLPKRAASHQQAIRLDHARDRVTYVLAQVEDEGHPGHVEYSRPFWAAGIARLFCKAVVGCLCRQALRDLH